MTGAAAPERVSVFITCLVDLLHPQIGSATVALLQDLGVAVNLPEAQTCCGQPAFNSGFHTEARDVARTLLDAFEGTPAVVAPSGSCVAMVRSHFPRLFAGTSDEPRAADLAGKTFELSEFIVDVLGVERLAGRFPGSATYHDACHGRYELGLGGQGRRLLTGIEGLELREMARPDACCGFGGTFALVQPEVSNAMADDKLRQADESVADVLVTGDAGCLMHLAGRRARTRQGPRPMHLAVLLARARGLLAPERRR